MKNQTMQDEYIKNFYEEVCQNLDGDYKIILEPNRELKENWIEYDSVKWKMEDNIRELVNALMKKKHFSLEEKIIKLYEYICKNYIYDANVLYFFKRDNSNPLEKKYIAVDWYGRIVGQDWIEKRKKHNRRVCYEFSRSFAKAINTLISADGNQLEAFMLGDKENTHYVVGLTGKDYSAILDPDDFNSIKDLTRVKMGLTIKGIHILRDETGLLRKALDKFNADKPVELKEIEEAKRNLRNKDFIKYINESIKVINKYNIDSQGFFEYIRFLIKESGITVEKIWKEDKNSEEKRYERCLYFEFNNKTYLLDSIDKKISIINLADLDRKIYIFNPAEHQYEYYGG